jgi:hypothetical protein
VNVASSRLPRQPGYTAISSHGRRPTLLAIARISISIAVALSAAQASAEIYKCTSSKSIPRYQNFPCEFDSLGSAANTTAAADAAAQRASGASGDHVHAMPAATTPHVGMTTKQVKAVWGEPVETTREEYAKGDIETWMYAGSRSIRFDMKGRVAEIKW